MLNQTRPSLELISRICKVENNTLETEVFGLKFPNPVGLAAGMDKNAKATRTWEALGFGFVEIGSVTALAQPGNEQPRLFRLPADLAIINRMGFNNEGAEAVAGRLAKTEKDFGRLSVPLGINLGKSKLTPLEDAPSDYLKSLELLWNHGDYFVVNVSSPNTPGLRELQDKDKLDELLAAVTGFARSQETEKPILLKIAPDLEWAQIDEIISLVEKHGIAGLIATNTTISREGLKTRVNETGGLSGLPLKNRSVEVLKYLKQELKIKLPVVSVGGIFKKEDVEERLELGASLVQVYTGFIYEGPMMMKKLLIGLEFPKPIYADQDDTV